MTKDSIEQWVGNHAVKFIIYAVALGIAWGTMTGALAQKANREEVQQAEAHVNAKVDSVARKVDAVLYLVCKDHRNDSVCR